MLERHFHASFETNRESRFDDDHIAKILRARKTNGFSSIFENEDMGYKHQRLFEGKCFYIFLFMYIYISLLFSNLENFEKRGYAKYMRFQLRVGVVINSSTSVNGKLRNRWNISILSSRFVQFPLFPERGIYAPRATLTHPARCC